MLKRLILFTSVNSLITAVIASLFSVFQLEEFFNLSPGSIHGVIGLCVLWGSLGSLISLLSSKRIAKYTYSLFPASRDGEMTELEYLVRDIAMKAGLKEVPEVYLYDSVEVNAFATGWNKNNSLVAFSTGLLNNLDKDSIEAVVAHEIGHIANGDMVTMAIIQGAVNSFSLFISRMVLFAISRVFGKFVTLITSRILLFFLDIIICSLTRPIVLWLSRSREFRADKAAAQLVGKQKIINALCAISGQPVLIEKNNHFQTAKISGYFGRFDIFSTHPSIKRRIAYIESL